MVEPIGEMLGADRVVATRMVTVDGRYTGEIEFYAYDENKAEAMRAVAAEGGYDLADCYAYSDSITDLPMLSAVGHPTVVNPDRGLRKAALERGWPVLQFTRPVTIRSRFSTPSAPVVTGAAMGVGAAVVGLAWYARHRALRGPACAADSRPASRPPPAPRRLTSPAEFRRPGRRRGTGRSRGRVVHPAVVFPVVVAWLAARGGHGRRGPLRADRTRRVAGAAAPAAAGSACSCRCPAPGWRCSPPWARGAHRRAGWPPRPAVRLAVVVVALLGLVLAPH